MNRKILVADDDKKTVELIKLYLERDGYRVQVAYDGREAIELARRKSPDLIVLDLMLPSVDGLDVCRALRAESQVPVIMLTARTTEEDRLAGLDTGADDYVTKPFSPRELVARVRAVLRRSGVEDGPQELHFGDPSFAGSGPDSGQGLLIDFLRHEVKLRGEPVHLTPKEFKLLATLAREPGRAFSRLELLEKVFGYDYEGLERTLDVHIMNLRKKIEADPSSPSYILTVYGVGYKFNEDLSHAQP
jgi:two-component system, OmpR family, alkaline phosphatase synthesis response regulator PhoP